MAVLYTDSAILPLLFIPSNSSGSCSYLPRSLKELCGMMPEDIGIDLERGVTAPIKQGNGYQPSLGSEDGRFCPIAVQHLDGRAVLINATIKEEDGDLALSSAKRQICRAVSKRWHQRLVGRLLMGLVVGTARVKQVHRISGRKFEFFPSAYTSSQRSCIADRDRVPAGSKDHQSRHLESISKTSPSTSYSRNHSTTLTWSYARHLTP